MTDRNGRAGQADAGHTGSSGRGPEVRPNRFVLLSALTLVVIMVAAMVTQRDTSGGFLPALVTVAAIALVLIAVRSVFARIRLDGDALVHTDLFGRRRLSLQEMDRPVVLEPRRRSSSGRRSGSRDYELIIRRRGGRGPWLLATGMFWERDGLRRMANAIDAVKSSAVSRAAVEKTYPGSTTWLLRRTQTQWSIFLGISLMVGLLLWQTR